MSESEKGWDLLGYDDGRFEIMPHNDLRTHRAGLRCWCHPKVQKDDPGLLIHRARDKREVYETGQLKRLDWMDEPIKENK